MMGHALILTKTEGTKTVYYLMTKDLTEPQKIDLTVEAIEERYYVLKDSDKNYIYYNDCGTEIFRCEKKLSEVCQSEDDSTILFRSDKLFYRMMK